MYVRKFVDCDRQRVPVYSVLGSKLRVIDAEQR